MMSTFFTLHLQSVNFCSMCIGRLGVVISDIHYYYFFFLKKNNTTDSVIVQNLF